MKKILFILPLLWLLAQPTMAAKRYIGDINNDGKVDKADLALLLDVVLGKKAVPSDIRFHDIDKDKKIGIADVACLIAILNGERQAEEINTTIFIPVEDKPGGFD